jgi:uncharacterized membrane protein YfcA
VDVGLVLGAVGLVFSGVVKGAVGFGLPMIAAPVLAGFMGPRTAVVVMSVVNFVSAVLVAGRVRGVPLRSYLGLAAPISLATFAGILVGAGMLTAMSPTVLSALVGLTAMVFSVLSAADIQPKIPPDRRGLIGALIGLGSGVLAGTTSVFAAPIVMYFQALGLPKRDFMVVLNVVVSISTVVQIASYAALGLYTIDILQSSALTLFCVGTGIALGFLIQDRVNQVVFNRVVICVIFAVGLSLVVRAFT